MAKRRPQQREVDPSAVPTVAEFKALWWVRRGGLVGVFAPVPRFVDEGVLHACVERKWVRETWEGRLPKRFVLMQDGLAAIALAAKAGGIIRG